MQIRTLALAGCAAMLAAPALAQSDAQRFAPMQANDPLFSCEQLVQEAAVMEGEIGAAPGAFGTATADAAIGIGTDLAVRAGAGQALGALGGLGGLGGLARGAMQQREEAAAARKEMAQDRWYYLAGLYSGKACDQQQAAAVPPAPIPVEAAAAVATE